MSQSEKFIKRLEALKEGERAHLRQLAGQPLSRVAIGFDLFAGLWWPLRRASQAAPRRETSWLVVKLYGTFPLPHVRESSFPKVMGSCEPPHPACRDAALLSSAPPDREPARAQFIAARRFRRRFDALLQSPLTGLELLLRWGLSVVADATEKKQVTGLDWVQLLDDLSIWDRGKEHRRGIDIREEWAYKYLETAK